MKLCTAHPNLAAWFAHELARQHPRHAGGLSIAGRPVFVRTTPLRTKLARVFVFPQR